MKEDESLYLLIVEDDDNSEFKTGVLLGKVTAKTAKEAILTVAEDGLKVSRSEFTSSSLVGLLKKVFVEQTRNREEAKLRIYTVTPSVGDTELCRTLEDLDFSES